MTNQCCECGNNMKSEEGLGISSGICLPCGKKNHPLAYPYMRHEVAMQRGAVILRHFTTLLESPRRTLDACSR